MPFITIREILDIVIMTFAIGYIFSDVFKKKPTEDYDPLKYYQKAQWWENVKHAALIAAPAVVLHELAHKVAAIAFGAMATLHAPYGWYALVLFLKMINFPLLFFVGGYVAHTPLPPLESAIVSIAGPLVNLFLWLAAKAVVKYNLLHRRYYPIIGPLGKINLFLAIFNMIPLRGFDGYSFFTSIWQAMS
ncbi:M50 family metallopeptidase [Candidatus Woesearchaeota archaeon]|nr:M50 family metallopeptidase [Candidatus Woesearchaeota archaeon]